MPGSGRHIGSFCEERTLMPAGLNDRVWVDCCQLL